MPDPAAGTFEFPGGHCEQDETPRQAAIREWQEETGLRFPDGEFTGSWVSPNGIYQGFVYTVAREADLNIFDRNWRSNPDDPDGDLTESIAWWDPAQLPGNSAVRPELLDSIGGVLAALGLPQRGNEATCPCGLPVAYDALDGWQHVDGSISHDDGESVSDKMGTVVKTDGALLKGNATADPRAQAIEPVQRRIVDGLTRLADGLASGDVTNGGFVDGAVAVLRDGIREGLTLGTQAAGRESVAKLSDEFEEWRQAFDARFAQYASVAQTGYEEGQALANLSTDDGWLIRWDAKPGACDLCAGRNGQTFEPGDLPGLPGMGGFRELATVCRGGPNCRCSIKYLPPAGTTVGATSGPAPTAPTSPTRSTAGRHRAAADAPEATAGTADDFQEQMQANVAAAQEVRQAGHADPTSGPYSTLLDGIADQRAEQQRPFLRGLLQDLLAAIRRIRSGADTSAVAASTAAVAEQNAPQPNVAKEFDPAETRDGHGRWSLGAELEHVVDDALHGDDGHDSGNDQGWDAVERDYGAALDGRGFSDDGSAVTAHESGVLTVAVPGKTPDTWAILTALDPSEARDMADHLERVLAINPQDPAYGDAYDPATGLVDWATDQHGAVYGVDPSGDIRVGVPNGTAGQLDEIDLSADDAWKLVDGLRDMSDHVDEQAEGE